MIHQWRELKKLWKELVCDDKTKKKQTGSGAWKEYLDGDECTLEIAESFDVLWPWLSVVDAKEYAANVSRKTGSTDIRYSNSDFGEWWTFPLNFTDDNGWWKAIIWGCHLGRRPTFEEYFSAIKAGWVAEETDSCTMPPGIPTKKTR